MVVGLGVSLVAVTVLARRHLAASLGVHSEDLFLVTTLVAVFAFQPIRKSLERMTDGIFYRRTYDPQVLLSHLGSVDGIDHRRGRARAGHRR